jgi:hypothetical protein
LLSVTDEQPPPRARKLAEAFPVTGTNNAVLAAARTHLAGLDRNRALFEATRNAQAVADHPGFVDASRTLQQVTQWYAQWYEPVTWWNAQWQESTKRVAELYASLWEPTRRMVANTDAINAALRQFDGYNWPKLATSLDAAVAVPTVTATTTIPAPTITTEPEPTVTPETQPGLVWWSDVWRARALLAAALYFAVTASAEFEFKNDLLSKLENHLIVALAIYGAVVAWGRRQSK